MGHKSSKPKVDQAHSDLLHQLSDEISWVFKSCMEKKKNFVEEEKLGYFLQDFPLDSSEAKRLLEILKKMNGEDLPIEKIFGIYNPTLVANFSSHKIILEEKLSDEPNMWKQIWRKNDPNGLRAWVYEKYTQIVNMYNWNKDQKVPVIMTAHGTGVKIANKISLTGFASLASLDAGYFGQGIYFTTSIPYALPYARLQEDPAIIISYVIPGNIYPVVEHHKEENSLLGSPIKAPGYNSHYVITARDGSVAQTIGEIPVFDEIVIDQEAQVTPAFILQLSTDSSKLQRFYKEFDRQLPV